MPGSSGTGSSVSVWSPSGSTPPCTICWMRDARQLLEHRIVRLGKAEGHVLEARVDVGAGRVEVGLREHGDHLLPVEFEPDPKPKARRRAGGVDVEKREREGTGVVARPLVHHVGRFEAGREAEEHRLRRLGLRGARAQQRAGLQEHGEARRAQARTPADRPEGEDGQHRGGGREDRKT